MFFKGAIPHLDPAFGEVIGARLALNLCPVGGAGTEEDPDAIIRARDHQSGAPGFQADHRHGTQAVP
jgi:hypothetical protein